MRLTSPYRWGATLLAWGIILSSANAQITVCSSGCPSGIAIPDAGCPTATTSTINVTGVGTIDNTFGLVQVCVYITHTWRSDIDMYLVAPDGTRVELSTDNGSLGDDFGAGCTTGQMLCFDMNAATSITAWTDTDPATGTYQPEGCLGLVNNGQNADGTWTLEVCDDASGDNGAIEGWCLVFDNNPPDPSSCPVTVNCPSGDDCASAYILTGTSGSVNFDLNGCTGDYDASCTSACGLDQVFQIDVPNGYCIEWWVSNDDFDVVGYTYINGCPGTGTEVTCSDNDAFTHIWTNNTGITQTVYMVVDVWGSSSCTGTGTGQLNWQINIPQSSACQMNYTITPIPYQDPPNGYLTGTSLKGTFDDPDDEYSNNWIPFPFTFCFDGNWYDSALIADNGYIIFPTPCNPDQANSTSEAVPGGYSPWNHDPTLNWPCNVSGCGPFNAIAMIWRDFRLNGEGTDNTPNQNWDIRYEVVGTAPNRKFYIKFYEIPQFGSNCREDPTKNTTGYIMLEEGTNAIEIHIYKADTCSTWDDGLGIVGLHSINGQFAAVPAGYNNTPFTVDPPGVAWRFEPPSGCCIITSVDNLIILEGEILSSGSHKLMWTVLNHNPQDPFTKFKIHQILEDGETIKQIRQIPANINMQDYSIIIPENELQIQNAPVSYFVTGITKSGKVIKSNLVSLSTKQLVNVVYDPNNKIIKITSSCNCNIGVDILDISGKVVLTSSSEINLHNGTKTFEINANILNQGLYFVKVYSESEDKLSRMLYHDKIIIY